MRRACASLRPLSAPAGWSAPSAEPHPRGPAPACRTRRTQSQGENPLYGRLRPVLCKRDRRSIFCLTDLFVPPRFALAFACQLSGLRREPHNARGSGFRIACQASRWPCRWPMRAFRVFPPIHSQSSHPSPFSSYSGENRFDLNAGRTPTRHCGVIPLASVGQKIVEQLGGIAPEGSPSIHGHRQQTSGCRFERRGQQSGAASAAPGSDAMGGAHQIRSRNASGRGCGGGSPMWPCCLT